MNQRQVRSIQSRIHRHAANECANYVQETNGCPLTPHGKCVLSFDADRPTANVCPYFMRSVGPSDPALFAEYLEWFPDDYPLKPKPIKGGKDCAKCGQQFKPTSGRQKYCNDCRDKVKADQAKRRMKEHRLKQG